MGAARTFQFSTMADNARRCCSADAANFPYIEHSARLWRKMALIGRLTEDATDNWPYKCARHAVGNRKSRTENCFICSLCKLASLTESCRRVYMLCYVWSSLNSDRLLWRIHDEVIKCPVVCIIHLNFFLA